MKVWLIVVLGALLSGITYAAYEIEFAGRIERSADVVAIGDNSTSAQAPESIIDAEKKRAAGDQGAGSAQSTTGTLVAGANSQPAEVPEPPGRLATPPSAEEMSDTGSADAEIGAAGDSPAASESDAPIQPTFDVVSVDPDGTAVVAGRAAPGASVTLNLGAKEIGTAQASERGEWVIVPPEPLSSGTAVLALQATSRGDGSTVRSSQTVTVVLPESESATPGTNVDLSQPPSKGHEPEMQQAELSASAVGEVAPRPSSNPTAGVAVSIETAAVESDPQPSGEAAPPDPAPMVVLSEPDNPSRVLQRAEKFDEPQGPVTFDSVDYDDAGQIIVAGRTGPDADIRAYIDNQLLGDARADSKGQWTLRATRDIKPGAYELRVDQIGSEGLVTARVAAPFERAEPAIVARAHSRGQVVIQPGDNLWNIARSIYGAGIQYTVIYSANTNQIGNPDLIYPGQVLMTPGGALPAGADNASVGTSG